MILICPIQDNRRGVGGGRYTAVTCKLARVLFERIGGVCQSVSAGLGLLKGELRRPLIPFVALPFFYFMRDMLRKSCPSLSSLTTISGFPTCSSGSLTTAAMTEYRPSPGHTGSKRMRPTRKCSGSTAASSVCRNQGY
jgi:hypothetical protein